MKFLVVCLFAILGAAVAKPVEGDQMVKVKEPVPLIVSDYSSVAKDDASSAPEKNLPVAVNVSPVEAVKPEVMVVADAAPEATDAPATDAPKESDEAELEKEFAEEVKQEEKLLKTVPVEEQVAPAASVVDEVRKEQEPVVEVEQVVVDEKRAEEEEVAATTEPAVVADEVKEAEPVVEAKTVEDAEEVVDVVKAEEPMEESKPVEEAKPVVEEAVNEVKSGDMSEDVAFTTEANFVPAKDPASRVVREAAEEDESVTESATDEPKSEEVNEARSDDTTEEDPEVTTTASE